MAAFHNRNRFCLIRITPHRRSPGMRIILQLSLANAAPECIQRNSTFITLAQSPSAAPVPVMDYVQFLADKSVQCGLER
jgi:hypothetical protein